MSTPAGRPLYRPDFLDYAPKRVREIMDPRRADSPDPIPIAPRSPAPDEPGNERRPDDDEPHDAPLVPDDPPDEATQHEAAHHRAACDEASYDEAPYDEPPYDDVDAEADRRRDEAAYDDFPYDDDATLEDLDEQRAHVRAHDGSHHAGEQTEHEDELARLVSMLKSIRRDNDAAASPEPPRRAGSLPPLGSVYDSDLVIDGLRVPPSLRPSRVPPARHSHGAGHARLMLGVALACVVATGLAWVVAGGWHSSAPPTAAQAAGEPARDSSAADQSAMPMAERGSRLASVPASYALATAEPAAEAPKAPVDQPPPVPVQAPGPRVVPLVRVPAWPSDTQGGGAPQPAAPSLASLPPAAAPQSSPPPEPPTPPPEPAMNAQEIDLLLNQGKQFIAVGDLVTARIVLQRAADAGVAPAALALGETYDPAVLAQQGVRGLNGDVAQARRWYVRAQALGSAEAARRLAAMAPP
jgi:TPR repeat protein